MLQLSRHAYWFVLYINIPISMVEHVNPFPTNGGMHTQVKEPPDSAVHTALVSHGCCSQGSDRSDVVGSTT